jgi:chorismate synthase
VAKKVLEDELVSEDGFSLSARLVEVGGSADSEAWPAMIEGAMAEGDSLGGIIECVCKGVDVGYGEPMFDSMESQISHLAFSVPGVRGVEFGDGFRAAGMKGSEHNDCYIDTQGHTATNGAGGINGGITNGNPIVFRVAIKPTSSISKVQRTYDFIKEEMVDFSVPGRHDTCIALRCPVIIEAITAIVLADNVL